MPTGVRYADQHTQSFGRAKHPSLMKKKFYIDDFSEADWQRLRKILADPEKLGSYEAFEKYCSQQACCVDLAELQRYCGIEQAKIMRFES